jgi:Rhomboid family
MAGSEHALVPLGALPTGGWPAADWWRILTFSFLHLTWLHLAINTVGLVWLGRIVEGRLGSAAFAAIIVAGAAASGAAGMLAFRRQPAQASEGDRRLRRPLLICFIAVTGISFVPGVSVAGHRGDFVVGALMASMFI